MREHRQRAEEAENHVPYYLEPGGTETLEVNASSEEPMGSKPAGPARVPGGQITTGLNRGLATRPWNLCLVVAFTAAAQMWAFPTPARPQTAEQDTTPIPFGRLDRSAIAESSGLVASRRHPGVLWTHNDSGDSSRIFAITEHGEMIAEIAVEGAAHRDWEDIAIDDSGRLYLGDMGNNSNRRADLVIYVVPEPDPRSATSVSVERSIRFRFPELPYPPAIERRNFDAESLFWARGNLYLLSKHRSNTRTNLYRFPSLDGRGRAVLERIGTFDLGGGDRRYGGMATAADVTTDGSHLVVLSYHAVFLFARPEEGDDYLSRPLGRIDLTYVVSRQCESVAWLGDDVMFGNEQGDLHLLREPRALRRDRYP